MAGSQHERTFLLVEHFSSSGSTYFSISSPDSPSWSQITNQTTKENGTSLALYARGAEGTPEAIVHEHKVSDRPGLSESTQAIAGDFRVVDRDGTRLATLRKNPMISIIRTTWNIHFADGSQAIGGEAHLLKALLHRLLMLAEFVIDVPIQLSTKFVFRDPEGTVFSFETQRDRNPTIRVTVSPRIDERIALLQAALTRAR